MMDKSVTKEMETEETSSAKVRQGYKTLMDAISSNEQMLVTKNLDATEDKPEDNALLEYLKAGDELYSQVKTPKECVMDATVVKNLSRICRQQAHQMSANINQFKHEEYVMKLKRGMSIANSGLDKKKWLMLGEQAKVMFRRSPSLSFMYGALSAVPLLPAERKTKERKARQATKISELKETQAQTLEEPETSDNITDQIVTKIFKQLLVKWKENDKKPINYFRLVLHPDSFGKTVENMFHVSFLVKEKKVGISICPETQLPVIEPISSKKNSDEDSNKSQVVMNISMENWKVLVNKLNITIPMLVC